MQGQRGEGTRATVVADRVWAAQRATAPGVRGPAPRPDLPVGAKLTSLSPTTPAPLYLSLRLSGPFLTQRDSLTHFPSDLNREMTPAHCLVGCPSENCPPRTTARALYALCTLRPVEWGSARTHLPTLASGSEVPKPQDPGPLPLPVAPKCRDPHWPLASPAPVHTEDFNQVPFPELFSLQPRDPPSAMRTDMVTAPTCQAPRSNASRTRPPSAPSRQGPNPLLATQFGPHWQETHQGPSRPSSKTESLKSLPAFPAWCLRATLRWAPRDPAPHSMGAHQAPAEATHWPGKGALPTQHRPKLPARDATQPGGAPRPTPSNEHSNGGRASPYRACFKRASRSALPHTHTHTTRCVIQIQLCLNPGKWPGWTRNALVDGHSK